MTAVSVAREMGFDQDTIDDLVAQGLLVQDEDAAPWRPVNLTDVNWIVSRHADYDAEEARVRVQAERRLKEIENRKKWLHRYDADCQEIVEANLPRDASGKPKRLYLDLEDGRVKLQRKGGGISVDTAQFTRWADTNRAAPDVPDALLESVRATRKLQATGWAALDFLAEEPSEWTPDVLKTPIATYLKTHPEADLPGVSVEPVRYEFTIETKAS